MGVFDMIRGRNDDGRITHSITDTDNLQESKHAQSAATGADAGESAESEASFGANGILDDEKERLENPDHVSNKVSLGQQKAEAAALVWSRPVVLGIYAW